MVGKILFSLIGTILGVVIILKTHYIVDQVTGPIEFAESLFSSFGSGTYSLFRLIGFTMIAVSLLVVLGVTDWIYFGIVNSLSGASQGL